MTGATEATGSITSAGLSTGLAAAAFLGAAFAVFLGRGLEILRTFGAGVSGEGVSSLMIGSKKKMPAVAGGL